MPSFIQRAFKELKRLNANNLDHVKNSNIHATSLFIMVMSLYILALKAGSMSNDRGRHYYK